MNSQPVPSNTFVNLSTDKYSDFSAEEALKGELNKIRQLPATTPTAPAPTIEALRSKYIIDLSVPLPQQPIALEVIGKNGSAPIACYGAVTLVTAKAKSGKTFAHSILVSALVKGGTLNGKIRPHFLPSKKKVIVFDTEQSGYHAQKVGKRICTLSGIENAENLEIWKLRTEPNNVKRDIIRQAIYNTPDLAAIVIDGGRDTIFDFNDPKEAGSAATETLKWAEELNIAIIVILHQNKNDNNARGHYGTEMKNKSEVIANVVKDKDSDTYTIEAEDCRYREFETIAFKIDEQGIPYLIDDFISPKRSDDGQGRSRKLTANQIPDSQHIEILRAMFENLDNPTYGKLCEPLAVEFQKYGVDLAEKRTKQFLAYYNSRGWFKTENVPGLKYPVYRLNITV